MSALSALAAGREAPDATALVVSGRIWTWGEVSGRVAALLSALPAGDGPVALVGTARLSTALGLLALIEAGRPAVVLHPRLSAAEQEEQLAALGLRGRWQVPELQAVKDEPATPEIDPERGLAILFSSGSTGAPKAVLLSRRAFVASAAAHAKNLPFLPGDRWALAMPLGHVGGLSILTRALIARAAVAFWEPEPGASHTPFQADLLLDRLEADGATLLSVVPTMLSALLETGRELPRRIRGILLGGAAAPPGLLSQAAARGWPVLATYGLTEACSQLCTWPPGARPDPALGVGPPLPGVQLRVVDGEVQARGDMLCSGLLPPGAHPSPFTPDGWLRTGDLGTIDTAGHLHLSGRRSELIITGGENVSPAQVEAALSLCPGVSGVVVFGQPDPRYGEIVAAAVVLQAGVDIQRVESWCQTHLAPHRRPRAWLRLDALPFGANGKVDRRAVVAMTQRG